MKNRLLITGLATATILSSVALTQFTPNIYAQSAETSAPASNSEVEGLKKELNQLENELISKINQNSKITDKDKAIKAIKDAINKEDFLKSIENGSLSIDKLLSEVEANNAEGTTTPLPDKKLSSEELAKIEEAKKAEENRLESDKAQEEADNLENQIDALKEVAEKDKADLEKKASVLKDANKALEDAKKNYELMKVNQPDKNLQEMSLEAVKILEGIANKAQEEFEKTNNTLQAYAEEINKLTESYNKALERLALAKKSEASNGEVVIQPELPVGIVTEKGDPAVAEKLVEGVVTEKGDPAVAEKLAEGVVTGKGDPVVTKENVPNIKSEIARLEAEVKQLEIMIQIADLDDDTSVLESKLDAARKELEDLKAAWLNLVNEKPEYPLPQSGNTATQTASVAQAQAQEAPTANKPAGINPRTSAQTAKNETPAEAPAVAEAPKAQESAKQELPNTGSAEFAVFTPAVLSILAGLGLVAPKGKKEDK